MTVGSIVFARYDSRRLPGKALRDISGKPMLRRVLERTRMAGYPVVLATSERPVDDLLVERASGWGYRCFRGSTEDVAERALRCAQEQGWRAFVRVCGDRPFLDYRFLRQAVELWRRSGADLVASVDFPPGLTTEVVATSALEAAMATASLGDREHVTLAIKRGGEGFEVESFRVAGLHSKLAHLVVDTPEDLRRAEWIASALGDDAVDADAQRVIELAQEYERAVQEP